jgi:integral membrane protein
VNTPALTATQDKRLSRLNWVNFFSIADAVLLVILLWLSYHHMRPAVRIVGMTHGLCFIALVLLAAEGSLRKWWGWWFPATIVVTLGPIGSIVGERHIRKQLKAELEG